ncbi:LysR family transcriptional regulator [Dryocola sp. BD626]|uniref:LysR family transcriptional regulator n=1 Tax=Dryocola sp. BD626 TaxID=3133273 RepID=UPI003F4FB003
MIKKENAGLGISSELKRLSTMKENALVDRFKTIKSFDLNLLTTFEAVFIHRSGAKAADVLGITPSAVSQALGRLRDYYNDPLFIRDGKNLAPTSVAMGIHESIYEAYDNLMAKLQNVYFSSVPTRLIVNASPYTSMFTINVMRNILDGIAPDCEIVHVSNNNSITEVEEALLFRKTDIVFDAHPHLSHSRVSQEIYTEQPVVICRKDHPRLDTFLSPKQSAQEKHVFLDTESTNVLIEKLNVDAYLQREKQYHFSSPSLLTIVAMVEASDSLAIVPQRFYEKFKDSFNIKTLSLDYTIAPLPVYMIYNKTALNNQFFSTLVKQMASYFHESASVDARLCSSLR